MAELLGSQGFPPIRSPPAWVYEKAGFVSRLRFVRWALEVH